MKKILILGAGIFQLSGIKKAVGMGYYVITIDYLPENIGHKYSHQSIDCSTTDREGVLLAAQRNNIDAICTFSSDVAVPSVAYVSEQMELPGLPVKVAETMVLKHNFRNFQKAKHFPHPRFVVKSYFDENELSEHCFRYPLMFKPVDSSGSRGVVKVNKPDCNLENIAFKQAQLYSREKKVCIEEFVSGVEVGGDGFLVNGSLAFLAITKKHMDGFVVSGHSMPVDISKDDELRVRSALEVSCSALGYKNGPLNFDVVISHTEIYILEMSPRNGGNGIPEVIEKSTGVDLETASINYAVGDEITFSTNGKAKNAGSYVFGSEFPGILCSLNTYAQINELNPEVFSFHQIYNIGDEVPCFKHNGNLLGYVLFNWDDQRSYYVIKEKIRKTLDISVGVKN